jgi:hypothetical protein
MIRNHEEYRAKRRLPAPPAARVANVQPVLELDQTVYVLFRGRSFGIPPVAWRVGAKLLSLRMAASAAAGDGSLTATSAPAYFGALRDLATYLWQNVRPARRIERIAKRLGLLRNPFLDATELELVELTDFFLARRGKSSIGLLPARPRPLPMH